LKNNRTKAAVLGGVLAAGTALALLSPASPALAYDYDYDGMYLDIAVQSSATLVARGAAIDVPIDITCNPEEVQLTIEVAERVGSRIARGYAYSPVACAGVQQTGIQQRVLIRVPSQSGTPFMRGTAVVTASIYGCNGSCGSTSENTTINITK
jgi:hypothetical protein